MRRLDDTEQQHCMYNDENNVPWRGTEGKAQLAGRAEIRNKAGEEERQEAKSDEGETGEKKKQAKGAEEEENV